MKVLIITAIFAVSILISGCEDPTNGNRDGDHPESPSGNSYTVVYNKNAADAAGTMANSTFTIGKPQKLRINAFTRNGYNFSGWASFASGSAKYADGELFDISTTPGTTITLYAVWEEPAEPVPGATLPEKLTWLMSYTVSNSAYTVSVDAYYDIEPQYLFYPGRDNITIHLKGDAAMRTISLSSKGTLFKVGPGVTLVLDSNITLWGRDDNNASLVYVESGGSLIMNSGVKITGNTASGSSSSYGGGVYVGNGSTFTMSGGEITGNTATGSSIFYGGGVFIDYSSVFNKTGGTIFGYTAGDSDSNVVKNSSGVVQQFRGHAVYANQIIYSVYIGRDSTSGPEDTLSFNGIVNPPTYSGEWDY